jgi:hypothetical protein
LGEDIAGFAAIAAVVPVILVLASRGDAALRRVSIAMPRPEKIARLDQHRPA